jgi:hypothetical protein
MVTSESLNDHREVAIEIGRDEGDVRPTIGKVSCATSVRKIDPSWRCELRSVCRNPYLFIV